MSTNYEKLQKVIQALNELRIPYKETHKRLVAVKKMRETFKKGQIEYPKQLDQEINDLQEQLDALKKRRSILNSLQELLASIGEVVAEFNGKGSKELPVIVGDKLLILKKDNEGFTTGKLIGSRVSRKGKVPTSCLTITESEKMEEFEFEKLWVIAQDNLDQYFEKKKKNENKTDKNNNSNSQSEKVKKPEKDNTIAQNNKATQIPPERELLNPLKVIACFTWHPLADDNLEVAFNEKLLLLATREDGWARVQNENEEKGLVPLKWLVPFVQINENPPIDLLPPKVDRSTKAGCTVYPEWMIESATNIENLKKQNLWLRNEIDRLNEEISNESDLSEKLRSEIGLN
ncbi:nephrocystin-1 [Anaeramoeba flamelloides]|uniref:Nephrocystin-1 n=1 Tax=Anaeramoeba flamelloides TaxID=1746091 RepID=A0AAV7ZPF2_9EUKA|nr:nephrocystin-1 [Anaeramoeba flamelloides]